MAGDEAGLSASARFWRRVQKTSECWLWTGHVAGMYGRIRVGGHREQVHRFSYELHVGPIPDGLVLDHLCRNHRCVNPAHLEPVTQGMNVLRGESPAARQARQTECVRGHLLAGDNLRIRRGKRECVVCCREGNRAHRTAHRDAVNQRKRELYRAAKAGV
jgi:hypothetical protein